MSGWRFGARGRKRVLPFLYANWSYQGGLLPKITSWTVRIGWWSRNLTTGAQSIDTPGPGSLRKRGKKR